MILLQAFVVSLLSPCSASVLVTSARAIVPSPSVQISLLAGVPAADATPTNKQVIAIDPGVALSTEADGLKNVTALVRSGERMYFYDLAFGLGYKQIHHHPADLAYVLMMFPGRGPIKDLLDLEHSLAVLDASGVIWTCRHPCVVGTAHWAESFTRLAAASPYPVESLMNWHGAVVARLGRGFGHLLRQQDPWSDDWTVHTHFPPTWSFVHAAIEHGYDVGNVAVNGTDSVLAWRTGMERPVTLSLPPSATTRNITMVLVSERSNVYAWDQASRTLLRARLGENWYVAASNGTFAPWIAVQTSVPQDKCAGINMATLNGAVHVVCRAPSGSAIITFPDSS